MTIPQCTPAQTSRQLCECGCGQPTTIAPRTDRRNGQFKGQPLRFINGHRLRKNTPAYLVGADGCWRWQRSKYRSGYGKFTQRGRTIAAHIAFYEARYGPVPEGMELDHRCRNRDCCNPDHLEPVPHLVNCRRGAGTKLDPEKVRAIRAIFATGTASKSALARQFAVSCRTIGHVLAGRVWGDVA